MTSWLTTILGCLGILILAVSWIRLLERVRTLEAMVSKPEPPEVRRTASIRRIR